MKALVRTVFIAWALAGYLQAGLRAADPPGKEASPSLLLITLDTTRLDHLGFAGNARAKTPTLDRLAAHGRWFEGAQSHVPLTLPSHANILTGCLPTTLNLRVNGLILRPETPTLATRLKGAGYFTAAAVSSSVLLKSRGLARGFDVYDDKMTRLPRGGGQPEERTASEVTDAALGALSGKRGTYFLWVHYYDPHAHYEPPEAYHKAFPENPYDGEIAFMDAEIGRLLEGLKGRGQLENTLIVVAGDHGEGLGEHGESQHGVLLYNYALRVPLVMNWAGKIPPAGKIVDLCGLVDIAPTVLDLLGMPRERMDGRSLAPLLEGKTLPAKSQYAETYHGFFNYGWAPLRALVTPEWKYIEAPRPELYRWKIGEKESLLSREGKTGAELRKSLSAFPEADAPAQAEVEALLKDPSNAEAIKSLVSLGYLSGAGGPPAQKSLLDPKDVVGIEKELREAQDQMLMGDLDKAEASLLAILKKNPSNVPGLSILAGLYMRQEKLDKAKVCLEGAVRLKPQLPDEHLNLGTVYKRMGDLARAEKEYRVALALEPASGIAAANLARLLHGRGQEEEARRVLEASLQAGAESPDLFFEAGLLSASKGDLERARFLFTRAVGLDPMRHEALANLGRIAFQSGRVDEAISHFERAARIAPRNSQYLATMGSLYLSGKDDPKSALRYYRQALAVDPYGPESRKLKEMIAELQSALQAQGISP